KSVDSMIIIWPDRSFTRFDHPASDSVYTIQQPDNVNITPPPASPPVQPLLEMVTSTFDKHQEDDYVDFYYERNVPMMLSREGPKAALGDVNGDGLQDVYICGATGTAGQLYLQTNNGFVKKP